MLYTLFQASKPCGSEEEAFLYIFSMYFNGSHLRPSGKGPSWTLGPSFEQTWSRTVRQCYILNFKNQSQVVLKKKIF